MTQAASRKFHCWSWRLVRLSKVKVCC